MATAEGLCGICDYRQLSKSSVIWCSECDEGLCEDCKEHHAVSKGTRNHKTTSIKEYKQLPSYILEINQFCDIHNERFSTFCKDHNCACCRVCTIENHKNCPNIAKIEDVIHNFKSSNAFLEVEQVIEDTIENIDRILKNRKENLLGIADEKKRIKKQIDEVRVKINNHLDYIQDSLVEEIEAVSEKERKIIHGVIKSLEENEKKMREFQTNQTNIKQHASDLQAYFALNEIENSVSSVDQSIQLLKIDGSLNQKDMHWAISKEIADMTKVVKRFGDVHIKSKPSTVMIIRKKDKQAQMITHAISSSNTTDTITLTLLKKNYNIGSYVKGCALLPEGRMTFTNYSHGKVKVFKSDGLVDFEISVPTYAYDIDYSDETKCMYVTSGYSTEKRIHIIDVQNKKIKKSLPVSHYIFGIIATNQMLYCCVFGKGVCKVNPDSGSLSTIRSFDLNCESLIAAFNNHLYFTIYNDNSVTCCDLQGKTKSVFNYPSVLKGPLGISVDNVGNVFVAALMSNNVIAISSDGKCYIQILSTRDGLSGPPALQYEAKSDQLLVANGSGSAFIYKVT